jgi:hypothetical protein
MSTNVELQNSNELSRLKIADLYSTISMVDSTGNAPKYPSTQPVYHIVTDEVYTNLVQISAKEAMDIKSNKKWPKTTHTSDYHGGRHHFLSKIKNFS